MANSGFSHLWFYLLFHQCSGGLHWYCCFVAKRYQYRQRNKPDNIYHYAEEYYANAQDEPNYDYDDYDNLNVETIH